MAITNIPTKPSNDSTKWAAQDVVDGQNLTANKKAPDSTLQDSGWGFPARPPRNILNWWQNTVYRWLNYCILFLSFKAESIFSNLVYDDDLTVANTLYIKEGYISDPAVGLLHMPPTSIAVSGSNQQVYIRLNDCFYTVTTTNSSPVVSGITPSDHAKILVGDVVSFDNEDISYTVLSSDNVNYTITLDSNRPATGQGSGKYLRFRRIQCSATVNSSSSEYTVYPLYTATESGGVITALTDRRVQLLPNKASAKDVSTGTANDVFVTPATLYAWSGFAYATTTTLGKVRLATPSDILSRPTTEATQPYVLTAESLSWPEARPDRASVKYGMVSLATESDLLLRDNSVSNKVLCVGNIGDTTSAAYATTTRAGFVEKADDTEAADMVDNLRYVTPAQLNTLRETLVASGIVFNYYGLTPPAGYAECNGAVVPFTGNDRLYSNIYCGDALNNTAEYGYRCNNSNGTSRNISGAYIVLPDLRGEFVRGWIGDKVLTLNGITYESGRASHSTQLSSYKNHTHPYTYNTSTSGSLKSNSDDFGLSYLTDTTLANGTDTETAPKNISMMYIIKLG